MLELGRKLEAKVYMAEGMAEEPIAVKFKNLPVEKGIKQILQGKSYVVTRAKAPVQQGMKDTGEMRVVDIRVLGLAVSGQNAAAAPATEIKELRADPAEQRNEVAELTRLLREAEKPEDRMKALKLLLDKTEDSAHVELIMQALKDPDPRVRKFALGSMSDLTEAPPMEPVAEIALKGESTGLRIAALGALLSTRGVDATPVFEQILSDDNSNPAMRKAAEAGLRRIERVQVIVKEMERRRAALATEAAKR